MHNKKASNNFSSKGQILSYDLIAAGFMLLLIITTGLTLLNNQKDLKSNEIEFNEMHLVAMSSFNTILSDKNCLNGGIVNEKNIVNQDKLDCVSNVDYNTLKERLGLDAYEYKLKIYDSNGIVFEKGETTENRAISIQRVVMLNGEGKKGAFVVYEK